MSSSEEERQMEINSDLIIPLSLTAFLSSFIIGVAFR